MRLSDTAKLNWGKNVRVTMTDGEILEGKLTAYTSAEDNEPDPESITIEDAVGMLIELGADEIKSMRNMKPCIIGSERSSGPM